MALKELYHPESGTMRVAGLMSGKGSNLIKIIKHGRALEQRDGKAPYQVAVIFTDNPKSKARDIGRDWEIPVKVRDIKEFYKWKEKPKSDLTVRPEYDEGVVEMLRPFEIDVAAYAGYMCIATPLLIEAFLGVNVHPADLSIERKGRRVYTGDHAVRDAILAGERELRSTTHIIEPEVDYGRRLMISPALPVRLPDGFNSDDSTLVKEVSDQHQERLKEVGDWEIFPRTLEYLADGRYATDESGNLFFDNKAIPKGYKLEEV